MALIVLAAIWAAFLLPPIFRARAENRPSGSISDFRRQLRMLARTSPSQRVSSPLSSSYGLQAGSRPFPMTMAHRPAPRMARNRQLVKRRRDVLVGLLVAMAGSLVLGFLPPLRALWAVHVVIDVLFTVYVALLVYLRSLAAERETKVRYLLTAHAAAAPEPALLYRRSAN